MEKIVGTAGHIDHGKTALVKALTGVDADRLPEEKRRGITIDLGFAEATIGDIHFGFVDVPGHERFVKNMLAGASGIDVVLLVVAATEGVMPQTREHFDICRLLGIKSGVIALTKTDIADEDTIGLTRIDVAELVAGSFLSDAPVVEVSSVTGAGIDELKLALAAAANGGEVRPDGLAARLPIDRSFSMKGFGAVVTGTLTAGNIIEGDELELLPTGRKVRVRGLQSHGRVARCVASGNRVAVNLAGVDHAAIERGMTLAAPSVFRATQAVDAQITVLVDAPRPLKTRQRVRFHIDTVEVLGRLQILTESGEIAGGESGFAQIRLEAPAIATVGDRFILRSYSPQITIAGGIILDPFGARHRPRDLDREMPRFARLARTIGDLPRLIGLFVEGAGENGLSLADIAARLGINFSAVEDLIGPATSSSRIISAGGRYVSQKVFKDLCDRAVQAVDAFQKREPLAKGMPRELLREKAFPYLDDDAFSAVLAAEEAAGRLTPDKEVIRSAGGAQQLGEKETAFVEELKKIYSSAGLAVPKTIDAMGEAQNKAGVAPADAQKLVRLMLDSKELVKVSAEFYFSGRVIAGLVKKLSDFAGSSPERLIDVSAFKDLAGVSRKYAIPLLEYFDREKVTVRAGEKRLIL